MARDVNCVSETRGCKDHHLSQLTSSFLNNREGQQRRTIADCTRTFVEMVSASQSTLKVTLPLAPSAKKPITTADLISRLSSLSNQLIDASQDNAAIKNQLERTIAPQLVDKNLLQHKDKGVKSYVAVCIVEALRICAPDAPFTSSQLKVHRRRTSLTVGNI